MNMNIEMGTQYETMGGYPVRIYCIDAGGTYPVHGAVFEGNRWVSYTWTEEGAFDRTANVGQLSLREVKPYADFKIDDEVIVWEEDAFKFRRHFAGVTPDGRALAFDSGLTSWTNTNNDLAVPWKHCVRRGEVEL